LEACYPLTLHKTETMLEERKHCTKLHHLAFQTQHNVSQELHLFPLSGEKVSDTYLVASITNR
jgi:hypothetical protein